MKYITKKNDDGKVVKLKNYKRRAKINKIKRKLLLISLLLIILMIILLFAPFMQIRHINCTGNSKVTSEEIISASNIKTGDNIIRTGKGKAIDSIENIPYVKSAEIIKKYPSTINIKITECQVYSYIEKNKEFIYLDETGKVLEISDKKPEDKVPVLENLKITENNVNDVIGFENSGHIFIYKALIQTLENSTFAGMVTAIDISDVNKIKFTVNENFTVVLGDIYNLNYKINIMASNAYNSPESTKSGTLNIIDGKAYLD